MRVESEQIHNPDTNYGKFATIKSNTGIYVYYSNRTP